jgi:hypothetical protein
MVIPLNLVEEHLENSDDIKLAEKDSEASIDHRYRYRHRHHRHHHHHYNKNNNTCINTTVRKNPTPNLDRIDQEKFPLDGKYVFPATAGKGVTMYIVDT